MKKLFTGLRLFIAVTFLGNTVLAQEHSFCGYEDEPVMRSSGIGSYSIATGWQACHLTYAFKDNFSGVPHVWASWEKDAIRAALNVWSDHSHLEFVEVPENLAKVIFVFYDIDVKNATLGKYSSPYILFDTAEEWRDEQDYEGNDWQDLRVIAQHEIGHFLGFQHFGDNALMQEAQPAYWFRNTLAEQDIEVLERVYPEPQLNGSTKVRINEQASFVFNYYTGTAGAHTSDWTFDPTAFDLVLKQHYGAGTNVLKLRPKKTGTFMVCAQDPVEGRGCSECMLVKVVAETGLCNQPCTESLIENGNFSSGSTFSSDLSYYWGPINPNNYDQRFHLIPEQVIGPVTTKDHTGDAGGVFMGFNAPGSREPDFLKPAIWHQNINLDKNKKYIFKYYIKSLDGRNTWPFNYQVKAGDEEIYREYYFYENADWVERCIIFKPATSGLQDIAIVSNNFSHSAFIGLDDISLEELCEETCCTPCPEEQPIISDDERIDIMSPVMYPPEDEEILHFHWLLPERKIYTATFQRTYSFMKENSFCFKAIVKDLCAHCPTHCMPNNFVVELTVHNQTIRYDLNMLHDPDRPDEFELCLNMLVNLNFNVMDPNFLLNCRLDLYVKEYDECSYYYQVVSQELTMANNSPKCLRRAEISPQAVNSSTLYPNPVNKGDELHLTQAVAGATGIRVTDLSGKLVYTRSYTTEESKYINIPTSLFNTGTYLVELKNSNVSEVRYERVVVVE